MKDQEYDYFYDDEQDAKYCYPGTNVLKNKLDIRDLATLYEAERDYSAVRQAELVGQGVTGDFSLSIFVLYISIYSVMYILGRARQERLIFPKEPFSVWCSLSKASLMICIVS